MTVLAAHPGKVNVGVMKLTSVDARDLMLCRISAPRSASWTGEGGSENRNGPHAFSGFGFAALLMGIASSPPPHFHMLFSRAAFPLSEKGKKCVCVSFLKKRRTLKFVDNQK